jgi:hypothetical protein
MTNVSGNAYALTVLSPIMSGRIGEVGYSDAVRDRLENWNLLENSPMAKVPQTYLCRYFILDDVYTESLPGASVFDTFSDVLPVVPNRVRQGVLPAEEHLKSKYLVFSTNFHGDLDSYLHGMWMAIGPDIKRIWQYCYGFDQVDDAAGFADYIKKCQLNVALFFVGSNDDPLEEQLKALYLKQELSRFAIEHQGLSAAELKKEFQQFIAQVAPTDLKAPSWLPGQYRLPKRQDVQQEAAL